MKAVIDGRLYDTETATRVCNISPSGYSRSDFKFEDTDLYRTEKGAFFIAGEGGALSRWAQPVGNSGMGGGEGITPVDIEEAKRLVERHGNADMFADLFGPPEEA